MQHDHVLKKFNIDLLTPRDGVLEGVGVGWGGGGCGKIFATVLLHLIRYDHILKRLNLTY